MKFDPLHSPLHAAAHPASHAVHDGPASFAIFAAASVAEFAEAVPAAQRRGFYLSVGRRMAASETLAGVDDAAQLCWQVNAFWGAIGWGEAEVAIERDAIVVRHHGAPGAPAEMAAGPWMGMILAVLEGAYDTWFRRLGSGPSLHTTAEWKGETVELRHGR